MKFIKIITSLRTVYVNIEDVTLWEWKEHRLNLYFTMDKHTSLEVLNKPDVVHNLATISGEYPSELVKLWVDHLLTPEEDEDSIYSSAQLSNN